MHGDYFKDPKANRALRVLLDEIDAPQELSEAAALLDVTARLVETAAFGAAGAARPSLVTDILQTAARLETQATTLRELMEAQAEVKRTPGLL